MNRCKGEKVKWVLVFGDLVVCDDRVVFALFLCSPGAEGAFKGENILVPDKVSCLAYSSASDTSEMQFFILKDRPVCTNWHYYREWTRRILAV